jgi:RNA 2',3'-cyclic 3'-phosphodiesterase
MIPASEPLRASHREIPLHNFFFAVMIPAAHSVEFKSRFEGFQKIYPFRGKPIEPDRLHLSVCTAYKGNDLPCKVTRNAIRAGDAIRFAPFALTFERALSYQNRQSRKPFVLTAQAGSEAVNGLRFQIGNAYSSLSGSLCYKHQSISPHVTLIWDKVVVPEQPVEPLSMIVQEFALVHSYVGKSRYDIVKQWPLVRF